MFTCQLNAELKEVCTMPETVDSTTEYINAVANLWKLVGVIGLVTMMVIFRDSIRNAIASFKNLCIKRGKTELTIEKSRAEEESKVEEVISAETKEKPEEEDAVEEIETPKEPTDWFFKMLDSFNTRNYKEADETFEKLLESEEDAVSRIRYEAIYNWQRYKHGLDPQALQKLEKLTKNEEARTSVIYWLATCYEHVSNYQKAIETYQRVLSENLEDKEKARLLY